MAWRSLALVLGNRELRASTDRPLDVEVRTTVHPAAFDDARLHALGCRLAEAGVDHWPDSCHLSADSAVVGRSALIFRGSGSAGYALTAAI